MNDIKKCYHGTEENDSNEEEVVVVPLKRKHQKVLDKVFEKPERADVKWKDVESLYKNLGGEISEGSGSRKRFKLGDERMVLHEPHPGKELDKGAVKDLRRHLINSGHINEQGQKIK